MLVNTLQYHDTVDFVQDSETEDPQLVAEPGVVAMSAPTVPSWKKNQTHRQVTQEKVVLQFHWKTGLGWWKVLTDSDWAGDLDTWKSTGGSIIVLGEHYLRVFGPRTRAHPH